MKNSSIQKIIPFLWFNNQAEDAVLFYRDVFPNSSTLFLNKWSEDSSFPSDKVHSVAFKLEDLLFCGFDAGPAFQFNPTISFFINCETEQEVEYYWNRLSESGEVLMPLDSYPFSAQYAWVADKFGISWQIILGEEAQQHKIFPSLLFVGDQVGKARQAMELYTSLFDNSEVRTIFPYGPGAAPNEPDHLAFGDFTLEGQLFVAMDSGLDHDFTFSEAISLYVNCEDQEEIDGYWDGFTKDGSESMCGWLKDPFGVSWQIVPRFLWDAFVAGEPIPIFRMMDALLEMRKLDAGILKAAYEGKNLES